MSLGEDSDMSTGEVQIESTSERIVAAIQMALNAIPQIQHLQAAITSFKGDFDGTYTTLQDSSWDLPAALIKFKTVADTVLETVENILDVIIILGTTGGDMKERIETFRVARLGKHL